MMGISGARRLVASSVQDLVALPVLWNDRWRAGKVLALGDGRRLPIDRTLGVDISFGRVGSRQSFKTGEVEGSAPKDRKFLTE